MAHLRETISFLFNDADDISHHFNRDYDPFKVDSCKGAATQGRVYSNERHGTCLNQGFHAA